MKNIAYKISQDNVSLPDGFITEYFLTDEDVVEGYLVESKEDFQAILSSNDLLLQTFLDAKKNDEDAEIEYKKQNSDKIIEQHQSNESNKTLFNQFLVWKNALDGYS